MEAYVIDVTDRLCVDTRAREWCRLPYPGHPRGCPNLGRRNTCPPDAPLIQDFIDMARPHWLAIVEFDLEAHKQRMFSLHPEWTDRQAGCVLYYQETIRKKLRATVIEFKQSQPGLVDTLVPEAMGVNVIKTIRRLGIPIETKPKTKVLKVALVGHGKRT